MGCEIANKEVMPHILEHNRDIERVRMVFELLGAPGDETGTVDVTGRETRLDAFEVFLPDVAVEGLGVGTSEAP